MKHKIKLAQLLYYLLIDWCYSSFAHCKFLSTLYFQVYKSIDTQTHVTHNIAYHYSLRLTIFLQWIAHQICTYVFSNSFFLVEVKFHIILKFTNSDI